MQHKFRLWLFSVTLVVGSPIVNAQTSALPSSSPSNLSQATVISALQASGYQAKVLDSAPAGSLGQITTGISGVAVVINLFKCPNLPTLICALTFSTGFTDAVTLNESALAALNAASFLKVTVSPPKDDKPTGFRVSYVYPCNGFDDAKFVVMVLQNFGAGIGFVVAAYQKLGLPIGNSAAAAPSIAQQQNLWHDKPEYVTLASAQHLQSSSVVSSETPLYPRKLRATPVEATVKVSYVVGIKGKVDDARVLQSSDPRFDSAAIDAMRKFTFVPAKGANGPEQDMGIQLFNFKQP
jgi:TonB family protein